MDDETTTPNDQKTPAEEDDFWAGLLGAAVLSGIAWWGAHKISKLFEPPQTNNQPDLLNLAWKHYADGEVQKARDCLFKWVNTNHDKASELNSLAWRLSTQKIDPESAVAIVEHIVAKLVPDSATYWDTLAEAYLALGRQEDARKACDEAWKHLPDQETQFVLHLRMGLIYEMQPLIHLAIQQYQKAEAINTSSPPL